MTHETETFGLHLMLDGYEADPALLSDKRGLYRQLTLVPEALGMHRIAAPLVVEVGPLNRKDPGGLSGVALIAESHISVHTFPSRRFVTIDVYTCQNDMDCQAVTASLVAAFRIGSWDVHVQPRGLRYPTADRPAPEALPV
ncbi:MAG: S-adenosylmethionine decarboxylase [Pseudomonadota bacterium]